MSANQFNGKNFVCSYCDSVFDGDVCPNCGATEFKKSNERIQWEENEQRIVQEAQRLLEEKIKSDESIAKHGNNTKRITVLAVLGVFLFIAIMQMISMFSIRAFLY